MCTHAHVHVAATPVKHSKNYKNLKNIKNYKNVKKCEKRQSCKDSHTCNGRHRQNKKKTLKRRRSSRMTTENAKFVCSTLVSLTIPDTFLGYAIREWFRRGQKFLEMYRIFKYNIFISFSRFPGDNRRDDVYGFQKFLEIYRVYLVLMRLLHHIFFTVPEIFLGDETRGWFLGVVNCSC